MKRQPSLYDGWIGLAPVFERLFGDHHQQTHGVLPGQVWDMSEYSQFNRKIIEEFRANDGKVAGIFAGQSLLLLHHRGRSSGMQRVTPLLFQALDRGFAIFASNSGARAHPDWYYNLLATPDAMVEVGKDTIKVTVRVAQGEERAVIWARQKERSAAFQGFEALALPRQIPVVVLGRH